MADSHTQRGVVIRTHQRHGFGAVKNRVEKLQGMSTRCFVELPKLANSWPQKLEAFYLVELLLQLFLTLSLQRKSLVNRLIALLCASKFQVTFMGNMHSRCTGMGQARNATWCAMTTTHPQLFGFCFGLLSFEHTLM